MSILENSGIPGPKPNLIMGNLLDFKNISAVAKMKQWKEIYGKIFGFYVGSEPFVIVCDPELAVQILIKEFYLFKNKVPKAWIV